MKGDFQEEDEKKRGIFMLIGLFLQNQTTLSYIKLRRNVLKRG